MNLLFLHHDRLRLPAGKVLRGTNADTADLRPSFKSYTASFLLHSLDNTSDEDSLDSNRRKEIPPLRAGAEKNCDHLLIHEIGLMKTINSITSV